MTSWPSDYIYSLFPRQPLRKFVAGMYGDMDGRA